MQKITYFIEIELLSELQLKHSELKEKNRNRVRFSTNLVNFSENFV